jgi:hypothetical protein
VGRRDADGEDGERRVIGEAATETGWYRVRHADDADWAYYHVALDAETGETQISGPQTTPWL